MPPQGGQLHSTVMKSVFTPSPLHYVNPPYNQPRPTNIICQKHHTHDVYVQARLAGWWAAMPNSPYAESAQSTQLIGGMKAPVLPLLCWTSSHALLSCRKFPNAQAGYGTITCLQLLQVCFFKVTAIFLSRFTDLFIEFLPHLTRLSLLKAAYDKLKQ